MSELARPDLYRSMAVPHAKVPAVQALLAEDADKSPWEKGYDYGWAEARAHFENRRDVPRETSADAELRRKLGPRD